MKVPLDPKLERFIEEKVSSGEYSSPEAVVQAGLEALKREESYGDFASGELDTLLTDGEASVRRLGSMDPDEALAKRRAGRPSTPGLGG